MNILDGLPTRIAIGEETYQIRTNYKAWLRFMADMSKADSDTEIVRLLPTMLLDDIVLTESNVLELYQALTAFVGGASSYVNKVTSNDDTSTSDISVFNIEYDSNYLYSAFLQQYGINLITSDMHYYEYVALFDCLDENTMMKKVISYRSADVSKIKDEKQRKAARKLEMMFRLPQDKNIYDSPEMREHVEKWSIKGNGKSKTND